MRTRLIGSVLAMIALIAGIIAASITVSAQDAATPEGETPSSHPAHIHSGTCDELGDVVYPLEDATGAHLEGTPEATPISAEEGLPGDVIAHSRSTVEANLDDLLAEEHAVNVHLSPDDMGTFVACADIEGDAGEGELILELQELNDSGIAGQAILSQTDDGTLEVTLTLTDAAAEGSEVTPEATPEG